MALAPNIFHTVPDHARSPEEITKALEGRTRIPPGTNIQKL